MNFQVFLEFSILVNFWIVFLTWIPGTPYLILGFWFGPWSTDFQLAAGNFFDFFDKTIITYWPAGSLMLPQSLKRIWFNDLQKEQFPVLVDHLHQNTAINKTVFMPWYVYPSTAPGPLFRVVHQFDPCRVHLYHCIKAAAAGCLFGWHDAGSRVQRLLLFLP